MLHVFDSKSFEALIVKILLELASSLAVPAAGKTQYFIHLRFNSTLHLINDILSGIQKSLKYFNGIAIVAFFKIPFAPSITVFPNNLALYLKDLKSLLFTKSALK